MNITQTLSEYVTNVLDTNRDGVVSFKDFIDMFPNSAIAIAVIFVDLVVGFAEYRVWDVGYQMTDYPYKAFGFVLVSAVPFYLGQIFWLYPVANFMQKTIATGMVASSLYTSWVFGTADLSISYDQVAIVGIVTNMTAAYIVSVLGYILLDDGIKANRLKKQTQGAVRQEKEYQLITRDVLRDLAETQRLQKEIEVEFGDADLVQAQLNRIRGTKQKAQPTPFQPRQNAFAHEEKLPTQVKPTNPTQGE